MDEYGLIEDRVRILRAVQASEDWQVYSNPHGDAAERRAAAVRLAQALDSTVCSHFQIPALGVCSLCEMENPDRAEIKRLEVENEELRLQLAALLARIAEGTWSAT